MSHNQGHRPQSISLLILLFALSACEAQHVDGWKRRGDGSAPGLADTSDCHAEARRQAEARYPPQRIRNRGGEMTFENPGLFPAEISFFEQCMRRKGFERGPERPPSEPTTAADHVLGSRPCATSTPTG
jgi:hypothetical protein